jgi:homoserine dehydrogenase
MNMKDPINVGLLGCGTVGSGVADYLLGTGGEKAHIRLSRVAVADLSKARELHFEYITNDVNEVLEDPDIHIIVELIGGENPALKYIQRAFENGKSVVTANKAVVSRHMKELLEEARRRSVNFAFEASVAGSIPIIRVLRGLRGEKIRKVTGILNGTSNYVLSRMEEGMDFEHALRSAQLKGFAEAEHLLDTGGFDARDKLAIVASLISNTPVTPNQIYCEGITEVTPIDLDFASKYGTEEGDSGYAVKSLASAELVEEQLFLYVYPALIRKDHPLASVRNERNAVYIEGEYCGPQLVEGLGAGRRPTTSAVVSDLLRVADCLRQGISEDLPQLESNIRIGDIRKVTRRGYVRMNLRHVPGSLSEASRILAQHGFNIEDSLQRRRFRTQVNGETVIPDIVTVEPLSYEIVEEALEALGESDRVLGRPFFLRFES